MRLPRAVLTIALAVLPLAVATPAHALTCPLVADAAGDTLGSTLPLPEVDIVSADVASGPTTVSVALRVASLDPTLLRLLEPEWRVDWTIDGMPYSVQLRFDAGPFGRGYIPTFMINAHSVGPVPFTVDVVTDTITWTVPRGLVPDLATPGATFTGFAASTALTVVGFVGTDEAASPSATYVDQAPGCIPAS